MMTATATQTIASSVLTCDECLYLPATHHVAFTIFGASKVRTLCAQHYPSVYAMLAPIDPTVTKIGEHTMDHVDYPHEAGYLYDCPACESQCHCQEGWGECVFNGTHNISFPLPGKPAGLDGEMQRHLNRNATR